jgi:hypothetical protein
MTTDLLLPLGTAGQPASTAHLDGEVCPPARIGLWIHADGRTRFSLTTDPAHDRNPFDTEYGNPADVVRAHLQFDPATGQSHLDLAGTNITATHHALWAGVGISQALTVHSVLSQYAYLNPAGHGLFPARVLRNGSTFDPNYQDTFDHHFARLAAFPPPATGSPRYLHPAWGATGYGWFAPGTDPREYGTAYLASAVRYDRGPDGYTVTAGWEPHTVGAAGTTSDDWSSSRPDPFVPWNDIAGLTPLVERVLTHDLETSLVTRMLCEDLSALLWEETHHQEDVALDAAAQDWKPAYAVRPVLTMTAVTDTATPMNLIAYDPRRHWRHAPTDPRMVTVIPIRMRPTVAPGTCRSRRVTIALFAASVSPADRKEFARRLQTRLNIRALGTVVCFTDGINDMGLLIVEDTDFLNRHRRAFGLDDGRLTLADGTVLPSAC